MHVAQWPHEALLHEWSASEVLILQHLPAEAPAAPAVVGPWRHDKLHVSLQMVSPDLRVCSCSTNASKSNL